MQRAQTALGEVQTIPEQCWYDAKLWEGMVSHADRKAVELGAEFDQELTDTGSTWQSGTSERGLIVTVERGTVKSGAATIAG